MTTEMKNYGATLSNLSAADKICLDFVTSSIEGTLNSMIDSQVQFGKNSILNSLKDYCFNNGVTPAATTDERIAQAFALGLAEPVAERVKSIPQEA
jgi:hypothetical protein